MKNHFGMVAPDVEIDDGKGTILISSEEGETEGEKVVGSLFMYYTSPALLLLLQRTFLASWQSLG